MKAILVIDIPKKYEKKLNKITVVHTCYDNGETRTMLLNEKGKKIEDYNMCYLKPLPKIKEIEWSDSFGKHNYKKGYNDCIKDILGEEE